MLILGDEGHYHGRFPWVTASLVVANVLVFVAQVFLGEPFTNGFSLVPEEITTCSDLVGTKYHKVKVLTEGEFDDHGRYHRPHVESKRIPIRHYTGPFPIHLTLLTSMFMHGDLLHLLGNMWFLLIFGRNVECALNHGRFLAFYTACGICAGLAHVCSDPHSFIPCLGASGAISGIMGAYVSIHPLNRVKVWLGWWIGVVQIPALVVIGIWFMVQYISAFVGLENEMYRDGIAYWNHLGGFLAGFLILRGIVFYLRNHQTDGKPAEEEPLAPVEKDVLAVALQPKREEMPAEIQTGVKASDPYATFMSADSLQKSRH